MKRLFALTLLLPLTAQAAMTPEALRASAERSFGGLIPVSDPSLAPVLPPGVQVGAQRPLPAAPSRALLGEPRLQSYPASAGTQLGAMPLSRLDAHKSLLRLDLGGTTWDVSLAASPKFDVQYFAFRQGSRVVLSRIGNVNDLRGSGVVARLDADTVYRFKVSINIFNPVRGSTLHVTPEPGTAGRSYDISTGDLLDAVKANSYVFEAGGEEYWLLYGTDADPATDALAGTRSFLFIHEAGLSSRAWPVAETALPIDAPQSVTLDQTTIVAKRGADGFLRLYDGGASLAAR